MAKTILVADDDSRLRRLVALTLGGEYQVLQAVNGQEALEVATRVLPDLVMLDVRMPFPDGLEVCRRLKSNERTAQIKVLMLTCLASDEDRAAGHSSGADVYFVKPFSPRALLDTVTEMLQE